MEIITAQELLNRLIVSGIYDAQGEIIMSLNGTSVTIKATDTIGNSIQEWLTHWLFENEIYFRPPEHTQKFPDMYLSNSNSENLLEIKSFIAHNSPAFDVANFDSYWKSIKRYPFRLDADYLIFAYALNNGVLTIEDIYLKKVWEITGRATDYPLYCQRKSGQIYTIRPRSFHSTRAVIPVFTCKEEFIAALYQTVLGHTNRAGETRVWLREVIEGYGNHSGEDITARVNDFI